MDIYDKILQTLPQIVSKAWLISRFDEDAAGKIKPKIVLKYFGFLVLDKKKRVLMFEGKFLKVKRTKIVIPLDKIELASLHMINNLRIKWRGRRGIKHNAVFQVGELDSLGIAYPSKKAAEVWSILINRAKTMDHKTKMKKK